jgi:hypothetical protein
VTRGQVYCGERLLTMGKFDDPIRAADVALMERQRNQGYKKDRFNNLTMMI